MLARFISSATMFLGGTAQMAHLWTRNHAGWAPERLGGESFRLCAGGPGTHMASDKATARRGDAEAHLVPAIVGASHVWALMAPAGSRVQVNGRAPLAGLCVLRDRDEIRLGNGEVLYFSTDSLATVVPFSGSDRSVFCGRCRQRIDAGVPVVCCPDCGIWFHQGSDLPCWTYSEKCAFCGRATALDAGFMWAPEE